VNPSFFFSFFAPGWGDIYLAYLQVRLGRVPGTGGSFSLARRIELVVAIESIHPERFQEQEDRRKDRRGTPGDFQREARLLEAKPLFLRIELATPFLMGNKSFIFKEIAKMEGICMAFCEIVIMWSGTFLPSGWPKSNADGTRAWRTCLHESPVCAFQTSPHFFIMVRE